MTIFTIIFLLLVSLLTAVKVGADGSIIRRRAEKLDADTTLTAKFDGKEMSKTLYDSLGFRTATKGAADEAGFKRFMLASDFREYAGEVAEGYLDYIIRDEDSVIAHWLRLGADGFRLDVADELPDEFIRRFKGRLRQLKPDSLLLGEVWEDASNKSAYSVRRRYFIDGELDSVMNYPWRGAILGFVRGQDDGTLLGESIMTIAENYPKQVLHTLMNSLGTHDTARILTTLIGDFNGDREYQAQVRLSWEQREFALERLRLAAFLQYTLPGCPCIYYGDDAGMEGCKDPFNRGCYPWGHEDQRFRELFRTLGQLKNNTPALQLGDVRVTLAGGGKIAFLRTYQGEKLLCCVNRTGEPMTLSARHSLLSHNTFRNGGAFTVNPGGFGCFAVD